MRVISLLVLAGSLLSLAAASTQTSAAAPVASPNGLIVPFSTLPACASLCGNLFNVQGACTPPVTTAVSQSCFCSDSRLTSILQGTAGVEAACGAASCQDTASLQDIQTWYEGYCNEKGVTTPSSTASTSSASSTSTSTTTNTGSNQGATANKTWIAGHYGWVIFAVVVTVAMIGGWITASYFRRRYLRNKEKQIEMQRPVSWGPHQMQAMTGGFNNSAVALGAGAAPVAAPLGSQPRAVGGEAAALPQSGGGNRESRGWLRKERR